MHTGLGGRERESKRGRLRPRDEMVSDKLWMGEERDGSGGQTLEGEGCGTSGLELERHIGGG